MNPMQSPNTGVGKALSAPKPDYPSLWEFLLMAEGRSVEAFDTDAEEMESLKKRGLVTGKKWIRLTPKGIKLRDRVTLG